MWTCAVVRDRNTAAWPAELPPPTTIDLLAAAELRLHGGRGVVDALALEALVVRHVELAVARAGRDDDGAGPDRLLVVEAQPVGLLVAVDAAHVTRDRKARTELLRLHLRAAGERLAGDAGRKAEIVLDLRRLVPACPPGAMPSMTMVSQPFRGARRPRRRAPPGRRRRPRRRRRASGSIVSVSPSSSASAAVAGLRSTRSPGAITTGSCVRRELEAVEEAAGIRIAPRCRAAGADSRCG